MVHYFAIEFNMMILESFLILFILLFFLFFMSSFCVLRPMLPVSLPCLFVIVLSVFESVYSFGKLSNC